MKKIKEILPTRKNHLGGGILNKNKELGGLEKFTKNKNQKRMLIGSIIILLLLVGGIYLYRTFALYEEKKEFNVLKGRVPNFSGADILLAITVDNKKVDHIPEKGNYLVEVDCGDKGIGSWDYNNWSIKVEDFDNNTKCDVIFTSVNEEEMVDTGNFTFGALIYSWANKIELHDCPTHIKITCPRTIYLFNMDTQQLITSGTNIELNNNTVKNIKIRGINSFNETGAEIGSIDYFVTVTLG